MKTLLTFAVIGLLVVWAVAAFSYVLDSENKGHRYE